MIGDQSISNQPHWRGDHLARWLQVGTRIFWQLEPTWLLLDEDVSWNKQSVKGLIGRFGADNRRPIIGQSIIGALLAILGDISWSILKYTKQWHPVDILNLIKLVAAVTAAFCCQLQKLAYLFILPNTEHTHTQPFHDPLSRTTRVGRYQKKHSPTNTHPDNQKSFINFLQLLRSTASSLFSLHAWQSFSTTYFQVLFGLEPSISHSMHFFTQSPSSFRNTWTT